ncbi:hypothetical protein SAMN05421640_2181 [Ekhidna lutea]|uniref:Uncharacterized protein n=1 Tax=Ekhidna lutea TaxID=447679 RepID=A0A239JHQ6_EKHLU|nr:hypothetical protein [Ekhidna lutea]SNT05365.1 hypothetical protein SAMN05421640_2181 [Ekhidna lutea]
MIKAVLKFLGTGLVTLLIIGILTYLFIDESVPDGTKGQEAEELADEMLTALNKPGFDTLSIINFTYPGGHTYEWNRDENEVRVQWESNDVLLNLNVSPEEYSSTEYQGYEYFINDSFWLIAPFKVRDHGVIRSSVKLDEGRGLLVTYTTGGVTPGDSYLWIIDEKGFPKAWKLWTSNVPIGGLKFGWGGWTEKKGVWFSLFHPSQVIDLEITDLEVSY